jgi:uncharacterized membrane protein YbhN (UPF0104 family)
MQASASTCAETASPRRFLLRLIVTMTIAKSKVPTGPMTKLLRPTIVIPLILSASVLTVLLAVGNVTRVAALLRGFQPSYLLALVVLLVAYAAIQGTQWHVLLRALGIRAPVRAQAFAYLVGVPTRVLPIGNFTENYLLLRATGTDFGLSAAATLLSVLIEVTVALLGLVILGLGPWDWVRPLILIGVAVFLLTVWGTRALHYAGSLPTWMTHHQSVRAGLAEVRQFRRGAAALLHPRVLAPGGLLGALYLVLGGSALFVVLRGLGVGTLSWSQVLAVYFFSLAFALIFPSPVDVGVTEVGGLTAFLVLGVDRSAAISALLFLRVATFSVALGIGLVSLVVLHDQTRALLRSRPQPPALSTPREEAVAGEAHVA